MLVREGKKKKIPGSLGIPVTLKPIPLIHSMPNIIKSALVTCSYDGSQLQCVIFLHCTLHLVQLALLK